MTAKKHLCEVRSLIDSMTATEIRALKQVFKQYYNKTKESDLFVALLKHNQVNLGYIKRKACEYGYSSIQCRSFIKLLIRIKERIYEFLLSKHSINQSDVLIERDLYKVRIQKLLGLVNILVQRNLNDLAQYHLKNAIKYSIESENIIELFVIRNSIRRIRLVDARFKEFDYQELDIGSAVSCYYNLNQLLVKSIKLPSSELRLNSIKYQRLFIPDGIEKIMPTFYSAVQDYFEIDININIDKNIRRCIFWIRQLVCKPEYGHDELFISYIVMLGRLLIKSERIWLYYQFISNTSNIVYIRQYQHTVVNSICWELLELDITKWCRKFFNIIERPNQVYAWNKSAIMQETILLFREGRFNECLRHIQMSYNEIADNPIFLVEFKIIELKCLFASKKVNLIDFKLESIYKMIHKNRINADALRRLSYVYRHYRKIYNNGDGFQENDVDHQHLATMSYQTKASIER